MPLRSQQDIEGIIQGLKDGTIDVISSDHKPNTIDSKQLEFQVASFGFSSFETAFKLAYTHLVSTNQLRLKDLIQKMSINPAHILGINKGHIKEGYDADLVILDSHDTHIINSNSFLTKAKYSPYEGIEVDINVTNTIINGKNYGYTL